MDPPKPEHSMPISDYLKAIRAKVGHDLVTLTAASISIFDVDGRVLLGRSSETGIWGLPGGAIDPNEHPADAAVRECFEETGLLVEPTALIGVFGGDEFLVHYPNGDLTYYTVIAFRAEVIGGSHRPEDGEMSELRYFSQLECTRLDDIDAASKVISQQAFATSASSYFRAATWRPQRS
ncbi:NUDIX domain-containing protein [Bradyrhizobium sp. STM 3843]|uniref:NUDIX domain-containing protein n=1 Tax=Bradyrhizobium sp. STM 3843 TaxID=551947 RepID=UPI001FCB8DC5|nr:NUDIX domain-containing protein [Bradyrhizobium sp. STM 3843]